MAVNKVVTSAAATNTQMDNTVLNPSVTQTKGKRVYHITIVAEGVSINPANIYDMLDAQYATIASDKNYLSRGTWIFNIGPS